jgi:hypothetical protein
MQYPCRKNFFTVHIAPLVLERKLPKICKCGFKSSPQGRAIAPKKWKSSQLGSKSFGGFSSGSDSGSKVDSGIGSGSCDTPVAASVEDPAQGTQPKHEHPPSKQRSQQTTCVNTLSDDKSSVSFPERRTNFELQDLPSLKQHRTGSSHSAEDSASPQTRANKKNAVAPVGSLQILSKRQLDIPIKNFKPQSPMTNFQNPLQTAHRARVRNEQEAVVEQRVPPAPEDEHPATWQRDGAVAPPGAGRLPARAHALPEGHFCAEGEELAGAQPAFGGAAEEENLVAYLQGQVMVLVTLSFIHLHCLSMK